MEIHNCNALKLIKWEKEKQNGKRGDNRKYLCIPFISAHGTNLWIWIKKLAENKDWKKNQDDTGKVWEKSRGFR